MNPSAQNTPAESNMNAGGGGGSGGGGGDEPMVTSSTPLTPQPSSSTLVETSSPLIKAKPSPQGTPLHTTFSGTQNFTPSTRISALNMVGDLLRKVGVRLLVLEFSLS